MAKPQDFFQEAMNYIHKDAKSNAQSAALYDIAGGLRELAKTMSDIQSRLDIIECKIRDME